MYEHRIFRPLDVRSFSYLPVTTGSRGRLASRNAAMPTAQNYYTEAHYDPVHRSKQAHGPKIAAAALLERSSSVFIIEELALF